MNATKTLAALVLTLSTIFSLSSCGNRPNKTSGPEDETDFEVVFYTPKGDTAAVVIADSEDDIIFDSYRVRATDKRTHETIKATLGTTVIQKPIPAIK